MSEDNETTDEDTGRSARIWWETQDLSRLSWQEQARCREVDPDLFYPEDTEAWDSGEGGLKIRRLLIDSAKRYCRACPVREQCLQFAVEHDIRDGIWGGTVPAERDNNRRPARREAS